MRATALLITVDQARAAAAWKCTKIHEGSKILCCPNMIFCVYGISTNETDNFGDKQTLYHGPDYTQHQTLTGIMVFKSKRDICIIFFF